MPAVHEIRDVCQAGKDRDPRWYRIHRKLSIHVTALLLRTPITLPQVSLLMLALGAVGALANASSHLGLNAVGWVCLYASFLLDKVDGEIARYRRQESVAGILVDRYHHRLVEPLLFLCVGLRAFRDTHSTLPVFAALAAMLAANLVEETQHLPAYIAAKFARETRRWPAAGRRPAPWLERLAAWMRPLKTFRTFITVVPLVMGAILAEAASGRPVTTWLLLTCAVALWVYAIFQAFYYIEGHLEAEIQNLERQLPPLPVTDEPARNAEQLATEIVSEPASARAPNAASPSAVPAPAATVASEAPVRAPAPMWPLPVRSARPESAPAAPGGPAATARTAP